MDLCQESPAHVRSYDGGLEQGAKSTDRVQILLLSGGALQRRLLSGFLSDTPLPDLVEAYASIVHQAFKGPLEHVGFIDLTEVVQAEGIYEQINAPSFAPWTSRGRIFGLPHDVHPVLLAYRADIVEAAGIDVAILIPGTTLCGFYDRWCATLTVMALWTSIS